MCELSPYLTIAATKSDWRQRREIIPYTRQYRCKAFWRLWINESIRIYVGSLSWLYSSIHFIPYHVPYYNTYSRCPFDKLYPTRAKHSARLQKPQPPFLFAQIRFIRSSECKKGRPWERDICEWAVQVVEEFHAWRPWTSDRPRAFYWNSKSVIRRGHDSSMAWYRLLRTAILTFFSTKIARLVYSIAFLNKSWWWPPDRTRHGRVYWKALSIVREIDSFGKLGMPFGT